MFAIMGTVHHLDLYCLEPTTTYEDFKIPKHLSMRHLLLLNDLKVKEKCFVRWWVLHVGVDSCENVKFCGCVRWPCTCLFLCYSAVFLRKYTLILHFLISPSFEIVIFPRNKKSLYSKQFSIVKKANTSLVSGVIEIQVLELAEEMVWDLEILGQP